MSSSPSRSPLETPLPAASPGPVPFEYAEVSPLPPARNREAAGNGDKALAEQMAAREKRAREAGRQEAIAEARKSLDEQLSRERTAIAAAVGEFRQDRTRYYEKVEGEVVQLALAIARKILHREAQVDPMLLAGLVRVALDKIEAATGVVLSVNPQLAAEWRHYFSLHLDPGDIPEILEDPALEPGRCLLRTSMGTTELGLEVQLKEIEQGLMDLLASRPGAAR